MTSKSELTFFLAISLIFAPVLIRTTWKGFKGKQTGPMLDNFYRSYRRERQPIRYWASMAWNALWAILFAIFIPFFIWGLIE